MDESRIIHGNALDLPLEDSSVDLIITSPPYFALRSYRDGDEHYDGQIGSEPTPQDFLEALWAATAEMVRVLKPSGSIWVNLGDKYAGSGGGNQSGMLAHRNPAIQAVHDAKVNAFDGPRRYNQNSDGIPAKSLMGLPWRYAIGCIDQLGLILRAEVVWCLSGGARVYARTPTGDRPMMIRDLVRAYQPENIQLWNGEKWTQVLGWNRSADTGGALEIELRSGERIGCTVGHQWPTNRGLLRANELRVGDIIDTTRLPAPEEPRTPVGLPDEDIGWLVGLYIAEGSRSEQMIQFAGHVNETARHARLARITAAYDGQCNVYPTGGNTATCNLSGSVLVGIIDRYVSAGTARTKRLSFTAWQRTDEFLAGVVEGYLSGDGHYDAKNDRWRLRFCENDEWAADLRTLAARLGSTLTLKRATFTGFDKQFPGWSGEWRWNGRAFRTSKPRAEIIAIRQSRARQFWDIGVADDPHLFALASGVLTHNSKPNGLPESVTDRVRRSHEQWFHFVKQGRYFSAVDEVREAHSRDWAGDIGSNNQSVTGARSGTCLGRTTFSNSGLAASVPNPLGKLPGSVWTIPSEPLIIPDAVREHYDLPDHFAAFPQEWPRRIILGWSPSGVCVACGEGRRPVVDRTYDGKQENTATWVETRTAERGWGDRQFQRGERVSVTGYACACPEPTADTTPAVILDPFCGTGTVPLVARALGRTGIGVDLSKDYCRLAEWRVFHSGHADKAERRTWAERQLGLL